MSDRRTPGDPLPPQVDANQERPPGVTPAQGATATAPTNNQLTNQSGSASAGSNAGNNATVTEDAKTKYGYHIVVVGIALVAALYIATIIIFALLTPDNLANNVVAAMGAITGVIGSLVAAYFGLQAGSAGKEKSDAKAEQQSALASAAMGQLNPTQSKTAIQDARQILQSGS
jgi:hypothetical protein